VEPSLITMTSPSTPTASIVVTTRFTIEPDSGLVVEARKEADTASTAGFTGALAHCLDLFVGEFGKAWQ